jgi:hypothetical protein
MLSLLNSTAGPPDGPRISCGDWARFGHYRRSLDLKRPPAACACQAPAGTKLAVLSRATRQGQKWPSRLLWRIPLLSMTTTMLSSRLHRPRIASEEMPVIPTA